jgi:hypothetical protein
MAGRKARTPTPIMNYARVGFGLGLGWIGSLILMMFVAMIFFIPGFVLLQREQAKEKKGEEANMTIKVIAYILMILGVVLGLGFGGSELLGELGGEFE